MTTSSIRTAMVIRTYGPGQAPSLNDTLADIWRTGSALWPTRSPKAPAPGG
ncbi:hypothetical protein OG542_00540 [Streptomyces violaceus]|uniref:hypothetical protein n=1 Tax=Streptomyces violaceus TaxID=1936 RepID=UPI002E2307ED